MAQASKNVRGLATCNDLVASGGEDCSIKVYDLRSCELCTVSARVSMPDGILNEFPKSKLTEAMKQKYNVIKCIAGDVVLGTSMGTQL